ncbi:hypothetical protein ACSNOK_17405 [Streptomyces sp. URMC 126]|uniref:hypothetical protein n=1 Tax=Streptomyces sp. URMC 126 TaxID=3423401 RepID=UPI003F1AB41F
MLMYTAWLDLPPEKHDEAGVRLRGTLEKDGYRVSTFRRCRHPKETMVLEARPESGGPFIGIQSAAEKATELSIGFDSPCMLPPFDTQEEQ